MSAAPTAPQWLLSALGQLNDVVLVTEAEPVGLPGPRIVYVNATFERATGYSAADVLGKTPRILQGPRSDRSELRRLRSALESWQSCRICVTNYRKNGIPFDVEFDVVPYANDDGWFTHWVSLQRDVTERTLAVDVVNAAATIEQLVQGAGVELAEFTGADGCTVCTRGGADEPWTVQHVRYRDGHTTDEDITPPGAFTAAVEHVLHATRGPSLPARLMPDVHGMAVRGAWRAATSGCEIATLVWRVDAGPWTLADALVPVVVTRVLAKYESLVARRERDRLERELEHARKLEAVGRLAGGVAHDFNNLLTVIVGNLEVLRELLDEQRVETPMELGEVLHAAERARGLVGQLLSISHRHPTARDAVDVRALVQSTTELLRRTIGAEIALRTDVADGPFFIDGDATLLQQALLNLALNSRDAIRSVEAVPHARAVPDAITLEARRVRVTKADAVHWAPLQAGPCIELIVRDTGPGMTADVQSKAFEPFFTTKDVGQGTGLGLSSVLGTVKNLGGAVRLEPATPHGVLVRMRFPCGTGRTERHRVQAPSAGVTPRTLLVVDDEPAVRKLCARLLRFAGHRVIEAEGGADALRQIVTLDTTLDGVLTDVRMPTLSGIQMAREIRRTHPVLPILFMSGDIEPTFMEEFGPTAAMLSKPFSSRELLAALREIAL